MAVFRADYCGDSWGWSVRVVCRDREGGGVKGLERAIVGMVLGEKSTAREGHRRETLDAGQGQRGTQEGDTRRGPGTERDTGGRHYTRARDREGHRRETLDAGQGHRRETLDAGQGHRRETLDAGQGHRRETLDAGQGHMRETLDAGQGQRGTQEGDTRRGARDREGHRRETLDAGQGQRGTQEGDTRRGPGTERDTGGRH
ncbi:hypothetical protein ACOMHN_010932 [Nucella lapillus]